MKTNRNGFVALALLSAALMFTGCGDAGSGPSGSGSSTREYNIKLATNLVNNIENGEFTVIPGSSKAKAGEEVIITAVPKDMYELEGGPDVRNDNNFRVEGLVPGAKYNTWTFVMPASDVTVNGKFAYFSEAIENAAENVTKDSSWGDIDRVASMIKNAYDKNARAVTGFENQDGEKIEKAIEKLVSTIKEKIDDEDITKWIDASKLASEKMRKFTERTCLYFVSDDFPINDAEDMLGMNVPSGSGWKISDKGAVADDSPDTDGRTDIWCYSLEYPVGQETLDYEVWLVPVAQYQVVYESAARDVVKIIFQDCYSAPPKKGETFDSARESVINYEEITQETTFIGFVGPGNWHTRIYVGDENSPKLNSNAVIRVWEGVSTKPVEAAAYYAEGPNTTVFSGDEAEHGFNGLSAAWFVPVSQRYTIIVTMK